MVGRKRELLGLAAAALLAGGCAHGNAVTADGQMVDTEAVVHVSNNNWADMNVYVVRGSMRQRLGMVSSFTTSKFSLPRNIFVSADPVRLLADPIGGARPYLSQPLLVSEGQTVEWRLENNVQLSSAFVR